jgi:hypothetical protein
MIRPTDAMRMLASLAQQRCSQHRRVREARVRLQQDLRVGVCRAI